MTVGMLGRGDSSRREVRTPVPLPAELTGQGSEPESASASGSASESESVSVAATPSAAPAAPRARHGGPAHARGNAGGRTVFGTREVRRLLIAAAGLGGILFVLVFAELAVHAIHETPATTGSSTAAPAPASAAAAATARLADATEYAVSATLATKGGFATIPGIPTPARVAVVTQPYVDSLQLYGAVLAGTTAPKSARAAQRVVAADVRGDIAYFGTAADVVPSDLGVFLNDFFARVATLESDMSTFEHSLHPSARS